MKKLLLCLFLVVFSCSSLAQTYNLKRVVITWNGGIVDDSAIGPFSASGTMTVNGNSINQDITFCELGSCYKAVDNNGGEIIEVAVNTARITARRYEDGVLDDLTILSLYPNIITMYVYDDGTVETHEWEPVQ